MKEGRLCVSCLPGRKGTFSNTTQAHLHGRTTTPHSTQMNQTPTETVEPVSDHTTTDCHGVIEPAGNVNALYPIPAPMVSPLHAANSENYE